MEQSNVRSVVKVNLSEITLVIITLDKQNHLVSVVGILCRDVTLFGFDDSRGINMRRIQDTERD